MKYRHHFSIKQFSLFAVIFLLSACEKLSDTGTQTDINPSATALVIGSTAVSAEGSQQHYSVRAGTEVLLSGKDSDGIDDPLLQFSWSQIDSSGFEVNLIERNQSTRVFTAPLVTSITELIFRLTVVDADGVEAVDEITVEIIPVYDLDRFLAHPDAAVARLTLLVAPNDGEVTGTIGEEFEVEVTAVAHWRNRQGEYDSIEIPEYGAVLRGSFPANYTATSDIENVNNPRLVYLLPQVKVDDINQFFETSERFRRVEIQDIDSVYYELQLRLVLTSTMVVFKVYAYHDAKFISSDKLTTLSISGDAALRLGLSVAAEDIVEVQSSQAVLFDSSVHPLTNEIFVEELKQQIGADNVQTGRNYYKLIDPEDDFVYLRDWLVYAGFTDADGGLLSGPEIAHAVYVNNFDLGFGRDMWARVANNGDVYSYVINYPNLESAVKNTGDFAVVVMEYSANPDASSDTEASDGSNKIVKFYSYVPEKNSGGYIRTNTMNFDGRGEKAIPGVCTACHYQDPDTVDNTFVNALGEPDYSQADLDSTFLPWDLDSFLYSSAEGEGQIDPSYNSANVLASNATVSTREGQEAQFKKLNEAALATYLDDPERHRASIELVHCMYGDSNRLENDSVLPGATFDSACVQTGWVGQEELYHKVYARHCRACHTQFPTNAEDADLELDFDNYSDFISEDKKPLLKNYVYELGIMPLARLTMDRFWLDFKGETPSAADFLKQHLATLGEQISSVPGQPGANAEINGRPTEIGDIVTLDASESRFSDTFLWTIIPNSTLSDGDCLTAPMIETNESVAAAVIFDSEVYFPCVFDITLTTGDDAGIFTNSITQQVPTDRIPVAINFNVDLTEVGYLLGDDEIIIDVSSRLDNVGDGDITVIVNQLEEPYGLTENQSVGNVAGSTGVVVYSFDALKGAEDIFEYKVEDFNGSVSVAASQIQVTISEIKPELVSNQVLPNSADLSWSMPAGFPSASASTSYDVFIKKESDTTFPSLAVATTTQTNASIGSLDINTNYAAKVVVSFNGYTNDSNTLAITTTPGAPVNLSVATRTSSSIDLTWAPPSGSTDGCYKVYRGGVVISGVSCFSAVTFTDSGLSSNTSYTYQVAAIGIGGESLTPMLETQTNATAPTNLVAVSIGAKTVTLQWQDSNDGERDFLVYRDDILQETIVGVIGNPELWIDTGLMTNTRYKYSVATRGSGLNSEVSAQVTLFGVETDVTYADNIRPGPAVNEGCVGCHSSHTESVVENYFKNFSCVTSSTNYGSCSLSMTGFGYSAADFSLIQKWVADGKQ